MLEMIAQGLGLVFIGLVTLIAAFVFLYVYGKWTKQREGKAQTATVTSTPKKKEKSDEEKYKNRDLQAETKDTGFAVGKNIKGQIANHRIAWVEVHGRRYDSVDQALANEKHISDEYKKRLEDMEKELAELRRNIAAKKRYTVLSTAFEQDIRVYDECLVALKRPDGTPRILIQIERNDDGEMIIGFVKVSKSDVVNDNNSYEFDLLDEDQREAYEMLVKNSDKKYKTELQQIEEIERHLERYNRRRHRIMKNEDGTYSIMPPTKEEIEEFKQEAQNGIQTTEKKEPQKTAGKQRKMQDVVMSDAVL